MALISAVGWRNFDTEMSLLEHALQTHTIMSINTKFPRLIHVTPHEANLFSCSGDVKLNVAKTILIQVGITLSNDSGDIGGTWQFNLVCGDMVVNYVNHLRSRYGGVKFVKSALDDSRCPSHGFC